MKKIAITMICVLAAGATPAMAREPFGTFYRNQQQKQSNINTRQAGRQEGIHQTKQKLEQKLNQGKLQRLTESKEITYCSQAKRQAGLCY